jgi:hypothetical protein
MNQHASCPTQHLKHRQTAKRYQPDDKANTQKKERGKESICKRKLERVTPLNLLRETEERIACP